MTPPGPLLTGSIAIWKSTSMGSSLRCNMINIELTRPKPIFVFDNPRTRSHLFWRWIGTHPDLRTEYHPYLLAAHLGPENFYRDIRCSAQRRKVIDEFEAADVTDTFESANHELQRLISASSSPVCHSDGATATS